MTYYKPRLLFTYGTMRQDAYNHERIGGAKYLGTAHTCEPFVMTARALPRQIPYVGRVPSDDLLHGFERPIKGEVYLLSKKQWQIVDRAEGHPTYYFKEPCHVRMDDGSVVECDIYLFDIHENWGEVVETGDFLDWYSESTHKAQGHDGMNYAKPKPAMRPNQQFAFEKYLPTKYRVGER